MKRLGRILLIATVTAMLLLCVGCQSKDKEQDVDTTQPKADVTQPLTLELPKLPTTIEKPCTEDGALMSCTITDITYEFHETMILFQFEGTENTEQTGSVSWLVVDKQGNIHDAGASSPGQPTIARIDPLKARDFVLTFVNYDDIVSQATA